MRRLWRDHIQCPSFLPQLRRQTLNVSFPHACGAGNRALPKPPGHTLIFGLLTLALWIGCTVVWAPESALAAEIFGVPGPTLLRVGDQNRGYVVELACLEVEDANSQQAVEWLRRHGSRGTKVNLRPVSEHDGRLVANVKILNSGLDLGEGLVAEGLATAMPCPEAG